MARVSVPREQEALALKHAPRETTTREEPDDESSGIPQLLLAFRLRRVADCHTFAASARDPLQRASLRVPKKPKSPPITVTEVEPVAATLNPRRTFFGEAASEERL
jgi:hypothetical protein